MQASYALKSYGCPRRTLATHRLVNAAGRCMHGYISHRRLAKSFCHFMSEPSGYARGRTSSKSSSTGAAIETHPSSSPSTTSAPPCMEGDCGSPPSLREIHRLLPYLTPNQLTDTLWYFAQHGMKPSTGLMGAVAERIRSSLSQCKGQDLSKTLWAFATLKYMPSEAWWRDFEGQVFGALTDLTDRELANLLWAFAVLERRPGQQSQLHQQPPQQQQQQQQAHVAPSQGDPVEASSRPVHAEAAANLFSSSLTEETEEAAAAGSADQGVWTPGPWLHMSPPSGGPELRGWVLDPLLAHSCAGGFAGYSATSLHLLVWSLGKLHYTPPAAWLESFLPAAEAHFFRFTPTELANIIWALAKLGARLPSEWLDKLLLVAQWRFPSFPARLLSIVAWSTATLNHRPQQEWLMCFEEQVRAKFLDFSGHELACVAWSLRRFGYSTRDNAVFYMLQKQQHFLAADFEILSNPKLLRQVLGWKASVRGSSEGSDVEGGGGSGGSSSSDWNRSGDGGDNSF